MTVTHVLDFVCRQYTGNFEREFFSYVFAHANWEMENQDYTQHIPADEREELEARLADLADGWYGEYGFTHQDIERVGTFTTASGESIEDAWAVRVRITGKDWDAKVTPEILEELKARAAAFFPVYNTHERFATAAEDSFLGLLHHTVTTTEAPAETL